MLTRFGPLFRDPHFNAPLTNDGSKLANDIQN